MGCRARSINLTANGLAGVLPTSLSAFTVLKYVFYRMQRRGSRLCLSFFCMSSLQYDYRVRQRRMSCMFGAVNALNCFVSPVEILPSPSRFAAIKVLTPGPVPFVSLFQIADNFV